MAVASLTYHRPIYIKYSQELEVEIEHLSEVIAQTPSLAAAYRPRWLAIQLLEGDEILLGEVQAAADGAALLAALAHSQAKLEQLYGEDIDVVMADYRYGFVNKLVRSVLTRPQVAPVTWSDRIDRVVTHRIWGIPIFLAMMWIVFKVTADVSAPYLDWVDGVIGGPLTNQTMALLGLLGLGGAWVESLIVDGVIAGVGGVLVFVPVLMSLYLVLGVLEDSGYMARAAFVMDRLMHKIGLHGKSFLPLIVGFGCTVPAFYATRTLENERDRILTGLLAPFMSCGARLPVYVLFAAIFFPAYAGLAIFSLYLLGIVVAIIVGLILKNTLLKTKEQAPFVMELPPYRLPTFKGIWFQMWERTSGFVRKATTIILAVSILLWFLLAIPVGGSGRFAATEVEQSAFAAAARVMAPIFAPLGFGDWESSGALITGFVAKEVVISTMAQIYNEAEVEVSEPTTLIEDVIDIGVSFVGATIDTLKSIPLIVGINLFEAEEEPAPTGLMTAIQANFAETSGGHGALAGLAFMVFVLLYTPCMTAISAEWQEFGPKWALFSAVGQFAVAWLAALLIFQGGLLLGLG